MDPEIEVAKTALRQYLDLAERGLREDGDDPVVGYPVATCLFAFVDAVGSFYRQREGFTVPVDGDHLPIKKDGHHFYILTHDLFGLSLKREELDFLYARVRSPLVHNAFVVRGLVLLRGTAEHPPFDFRGTPIKVNLVAFLAACRRAFDSFIPIADEVIGTSAILRDRRRLPLPTEGWSLSAWESAQASGVIPETEHGR